MKRKSSVLSVLAPVALLAALGLVFLLLWPDDDRVAAPDASVPAPAPVQDGSEVDNGPADPVRGRQVTVWVDGWSQLTAASDTLRVVSRSPRGEVLSASEVDLSPAGLSEVEGLAGRDPFAVTRVAARIVRFDVELDCQASGCMSQRGEFPLEWVAAPSAATGGELYSEWGVEHGLWRAVVTVPEDATSVQVAFPGWAPASFVLPTSTSPEGLLGEEPADGSEDDSTEDEPVADEPVADEPVAEESADDGSDGSEDTDLQAPAADVVAAAAFGVTFPLLPNWVNSEGLWAGELYALQPAVEDPADASELAGLWSDPAVLWEGLAVVRPELASLSPSFLTMLSSPTVGCNGALCVPARVDVEVDAVPQLVEQACPHPDFPERSGMLGVSTVAVVNQFTVSVELPRPVRQIAAPLPPVAEWPGQLADGVGPFTGDIPTVSGALELSVQQVWLFSGADLDPLVVYSRRPSVGEPALDGSSWAAPWWELVPCP